MMDTAAEYKRQLLLQDKNYREWAQRLYDTSDPGGQNPKYKKWKTFLRDNWDQLFARFSEFRMKWQDQSEVAWPPAARGFWEDLATVRSAASKLGYPGSWDSEITTGCDMDESEVQQFGQQLCQLTLSQDGDKLYLVATCTLDGVVHTRSVDIGPILSWVQGKVRDLHTRLHQGTQVSGLSDLYRAAVTTARQFAQSQLFRELASDVSPTLMPGSKLTFEETKKSSEVVAAAKKGDPVARTTITTIRSHADAGDHKAITTIKTMRILSDTQDQKDQKGKDPEMSVSDFYHEGLHGTHVGHSPVTWAGADTYHDSNATVRDHRKGATKGSAANWFGNIVKNTPPTRVPVVRLPSGNLGRPQSMMPPQVPGYPGGYPPGYSPGYPGGYPPGYDPYGMGQYPGMDPYGGMGYPGVPGYDPYGGIGVPGYDPYGGLGAYGGGLDPVLQQQLLLQQLSLDPVVNQSNQRTYDPSTDSFYSNQVTQDYDPNTDSFAPHLAQNPYSATGYTDPYAALLDPRIMGFYQGQPRGKSRPPAETPSLRDLYQAGL